MLLCLHLDQKDPPSYSVPHHMLETRWNVFQPQECGGCRGGALQNPEEDRKQTCIHTLQVANHMILTNHALFK